MRLEYTTEPTETLTVTTPIGSTYTIPIWRPIGERGKPVKVEVAPERRDTNHRWIKDGIVKCMKANDPDDKGMTNWQIADVIGEHRREVLRNLTGNPKLFLQSNKQVVAKYYAGIHAAERQIRLNLWHLRKEAE